MQIEGTGNLGRHLDLFLGATAGDQGRVKPRKDFLKRERDQNSVAISIHRENAWSGQT
jgi:hypothetical protein